MSILMDTILIQSALFVVLFAGSENVPVEQYHRQHSIVLFAWRKYKNVLNINMCISTQIKYWTQDDREKRLVYTYVSFIRCS